MKRVLLISEFSELSTGYANYSKNLLKGLAQSNKYEVAELAGYCEVGDPRIDNGAWKIYPSKPNRNDTHNLELYNRDKQNDFCKGVFHQVCLEFRPDYVLNITDYWYANWVNYSPYKECFNWIWMPTVDSLNQNAEWLNVYKECDAVLTYTDWSGEVLKDEGRIFSMGQAPPCASEEFFPMNKDQCKDFFGISPNTKIIGFVARNQRRKLIPDLCRSFAEFSKERNDVVLWLHTSYPDNQGWNIPEILMENGICSKVVFTYYCQNCREVKVRHFSGASGWCQKCGTYSMAPSNVSGAIPDFIMSRIFNSFDLYVQYALAEGFGVPAIQAAACGVPIIETNYSAMEDIALKLGSMKVDPIVLYDEIETGCKRASHNNAELVKLFREFFDQPKLIREKIGADTRKKYVENYSWDRTVNKWIQTIDSLPKKGWNKPYKLHQPHLYQEFNGPNSDYVRWLIQYVLGEPDKLGTFFELKLLSDLNFGQTRRIPQLYFVEDSYAFGERKFEPFGRKEAYDMCVNLCMNRNNLESMRSKADESIVHRSV